LYIPKILEVCSVQGASILVYDKALEYRDMSISQAHATQSWTKMAVLWILHLSSIMGIRNYHGI